MKKMLFFVACYCTIQTSDAQEVRSVDSSISMTAVKIVVYTDPIFTCTYFKCTDYKNIEMFGFVNADSRNLKFRNANKVSFNAVTKEVNIEGCPEVYYKGVKITSQKYSIIL